MKSKAPGAFCFFTAILSLLGSFMDPLYAQCQSGALNLPDSACSSSTVSIFPLNTLGRQVEIDVCPGDLSLTPTVSGLSGSSTAETPRIMKVFRQDSIYIGISVVTGTGDLIAFNFGSSPSNIPSIINHGNPGSLITSPIGLDAIKEGSNWKMLLSQGDNSLTLFDFGSSLLNVPTAVNINSGNPLNLGLPTSVSLVNQAGTFIAFISNLTSNNISRLNFGNSLSNTPSVFAFGSVNLPYSITASSYLPCDTNVVFVTGFNTHELQRYSFGNSFLNNNPIQQNFGAVTGMSENVNGLALTVEQGRWHLFSLNYDNANLVHLDFGSSLSNNVFQSVNHGNFGLSQRFRGLSILNDNGRWYALSISETDKTLYRWTFPENCLAQSVNPDQDTLNVVFNGGGYQQVAYVFSDSTGLLIKGTDSVYINEAPVPVSLISGPFCKSREVLFEDLSVFPAGTITGRTWDFGDGNSSVADSVLHQFSDTGTFIITLSLENDLNACVTRRTDMIHIDPNPSAQFTFTDSLCAGYTYFFRDTTEVSPGTVTSWSWDFGDGGTSSAEHPSHVFTGSGTYTVTLIAGTAEGCLDTVSHSVFVQAGAISDFDVANTCTGSAVEFLNESAQTDSLNPITSYTWHFGDNDSSNAFSPTHLYSSGGAYNVMLSVTTLNGCRSDVVRSIFVAEKATPGFVMSDDTVCTGSPVTFTDTSVPGADPVTQWTYSFGDASQSSLQSPVHIYSDTGTFNVVQIVRTGTACDTSFTLPVYIQSAGTPGFSVQGNCDRSIITFQDLSMPSPGTNITDHLWTFGDPGSTQNSSTLVNPSHLFTGAGVFNVMLQITSANGCSSNVIRPVNIDPKPVADFTNLNICEYGTATFLDRSSISGGAIISYDWDFGVNGSSDSSALIDPTFIYTNAGTVQVSLIVTSDSLCSDTVTKPVVVNDKPVANFTTTAVCKGKTMVFIDSSDIAFPHDIIPGTVFWNFGDGGTSTAFTPFHTFLDTGSFVVTYRFTATNGCKDTVTKVLTAYSIPELQLTMPIVCEDTPVNITPVTSVSGDTIERFIWEVDNIISSFNSSIELNFNTAPASHTLKLTVESAHGCTADTLVQFTVRSRPVADFTISPENGNPPVEVTTENVSTGSSSYSWNFGDGSSSTDPEPSHTYTDTGIFNVSLVAISSYGCKDTAVETFTSLSKKIDVAVNNVYYSIDNGFLTVTAEYLNLGNGDVRTLDLVLELQNGGIIKDELPVIMRYKGAPYVHTFSSMQVSGESSFFCVKALDPNNDIDAVPENNVRCRDLSAERDTVFAFPNPFIDEFILNISASSELLLDYRITDLSGKNVSPWKQLSSPAGINKVSVNTSSLSAGMYILELKFSSQHYTLPLIKISEP